MSDIDTCEHTPVAINEWDDQCTRCGLIGPATRYVAWDEDK